MVFNEVPYCDYYDSVPVKKIIELDKECLLWFLLKILDNLMVN
jgi:hypothetical protein